MINGDIVLGEVEQKMHLVIACKSFNREDLLRQHRTSSLLLLKIKTTYFEILDTYSIKNNDIVRHSILQTFQCW
jgi:hypothetical protein